MKFRAACSRQWLALCVCVCVPLLMLLSRWFEILIRCCCMACCCFDFAKKIVADALTWFCGHL